MGAEACRPKGMTLNSKNLFPGTVKAVSGLPRSVRGTCEYPFFRLIIDRYLAARGLSRVVLTWGSGYVSFLEILLSLLKSAQNLGFPSLRCVITMGEFEAGTSV